MLRMILSVHDSAPRLEFFRNHLDETPRVSISDAIRPLRHKSIAHHFAADINKLNISTETIRVKAILRSLIDAIYEP